MFVSEKTHRGPLDENWLEEYSAACLVIIIKYYDIRILPARNCCLYVYFFMLLKMMTMILDVMVVR